MEKEKQKLKFVVVITHVAQMRIENCCRYTWSRKLENRIDSNWIHAPNEIEFLKKKHEKTKNIFILLRLVGNNFKYFKDKNKNNKYSEKVNQKNNNKDFT